MLELDKKHYWAQVSVSIAVVLAFLLVVGALIATLFIESTDIPPGIKEVLLLLLGGLVFSFKEVTGFWLGSSAGSVRKSVVGAPGQEAQ